MHGRSDLGLGDGRHVFFSSLFAHPPIRACPSPSPLPSPPLLFFNAVACGGGMVRSHGTGSWWVWIPLHYAYVFLAINIHHPLIYSG